MHIHDKKNIGLLVLIFSIISGIYLSHQDILYDSDQIAYLSGTQHLITHGQYLVNGQPDWRGVGYGYFLSIPFFFWGATFKVGVITSIVCSLLALLGVYRLTRLYFNANLSVLIILLIFPSFHFWRQSTTLMSEIPAVCAMIWGIFFLLRFYQTETRPWLYAAFISMGIAILIRQANIFTGTFFIPLLLRKNYWVDLLLGLVILIVLMSPQLQYNHQHFGGVFVSGYSKIFKPFEVSHFFTSSLMNRRPAFQSAYYLFSVIFKPVGVGILAAPFVLWGLFTWFKKMGQYPKLSFILFAWIASYLILISFYAYYDERFLVPLVPVFAIFALNGFQNYFARLKNNFIKITSFAMIWSVNFIISLLLIQTSIYLHENRFEAFEWVKEQAPPDAGLATSEGYLGEYITGLKTVNCSKTWHNAAELADLREFIQKNNTLFFVFPEKRLYIVIPMDSTSYYNDIQNWLSDNYKLKKENEFTSANPRLIEIGYRLIPHLKRFKWPREKFKIFSINKNSAMN